MTRFAASACLALIAAVHAVPLGAQESAELPAFMVGAWEQRDGEEWSDEFWTPPRGGVMLGAARVGNGDALSVFEYTRIVRNSDGTLSFFAQPRGAPPAEFPLVASGPQMVEFANAAHDYPQRIRYWRDGNELRARISRMDGSDAVEWRYVASGS